MTTVWFVFLAVMVTVYVVLDGFDLGAGALHLLIGRTPAQREAAAGAVGPVWNGNEVWLIAAGGVLFFAFPRAYAGAFSGLYFGLILVLWLLVGRGLALELRHQIDNPLWRVACDTVYCLSSAALAFVFGAALGNVVRGVPLGADGYFSLPLFNILNGYALLVGAFGLVVLSAHGARFLAWRLDGEAQARAAAWGRRLWWAQAALFVAMIAPTYAVRDEMFTSFTDHPWRMVFPVLAIGALAAIALMERRERFAAAFAASGVFIAGLLTSMAAGLYPNVLPAHDGRPHSLTIDNASTSHHALSVGLVWWGLAMVLGAGYTVFVYRYFFGPRSAAEPLP